MNKTEFISLFLDFSRLNNLEMSEQNAEKFYSLCTCLQETNKIHNLTAIKEDKDIMLKHFIDSLLVSQYIPEGARVIDIGCGPGFPSLPLAIARPDLRIVALDSTDKKIRFLFDTATLLHLPNVEAVTGRAEDAAVRRRLGTFDAVVSRAVARLNLLCELCLPYVREGGHFLAMKGAKGEEELQEAANAIGLLGGRVLAAEEKPLVLLDGASEPRVLIDVQKVKKTPPQYPRAYAAMLKKPL